MTHSGLTQPWTFEWWRTGHCVTRGILAHWKGSWSPVEFPSFAGFLTNSKGEHYLFDTGYSHRFHSCCQSGVERLHAWATPAVIHKQDEVIHRLQGRMPHGVFLSHWHADHVGGLLDLPQTDIWCPPHSLAHVKKTLRSSFPVFQGIIPGLIPSELHPNGAATGRSYHAVPDSDSCPLPLHRWPFLAPLQGLVSDPFGDGSLLTLHLEGHTSGHFGLIFETQLPWGTAVIILVGDAVWGEQELEQRWSRGLGACLGFESWSKAQYTTEVLRDVDQLARQSNLKKHLYILPSHCTRSAQQFQKAGGHVT